MKLINSEDRAEDAAFQFRIPMSLGEAHDELDNCKIWYSKVHTIDILIKTYAENN